MTKALSAEFERAKLKAKEVWKHKEKLKAASPDRDSVIREFGRSAVTDHPDGSWTASIKHDRQKMQRAERMFSGVRKEQTDRHQKTQAEIERERVRTKDGRVLDLYAHLVETQAPRLGARPMSTRKMPRDYFGLQDATRNYEQGPDGLYFQWDGGWTPTNLWRRDAQSPQRDPDGNVWVEGTDGWEVREDLDGPMDCAADSGSREVSRPGSRGRPSR